jgi:hypothetical protein
MPNSQREQFCDDCITLVHAMEVCVVQMRNASVSGEHDDFMTAYEAHRTAKARLLKKLELLKRGADQAVVDNTILVDELRGLWKRLGLDGEIALLAEDVEPYDDYDDCD